MSEKNEILEQPESVPAQNADNTAEGSNMLGKFSTVEELCKAYDNLQSEFTRKSQLLAEMTAKGNAGAAECEPPLIAVKDEIIKEYLTSVAAKQTAPAVITANSNFAVSGGAEPKSVRDISSVAENFFRNKETQK